MRLTVESRVIGSFLLLAVLSFVLGLAAQFALHVRTATYDDMVQRAQRHDLLTSANLDVENMFWMLHDAKPGDARLAAEFGPLADQVTRSLKALSGLSWQPQDAKLLEEVSHRFETLQQQDLAALSRSARANAPSLTRQRQFIVRSLDSLRQADINVQWAQWDAMRDAQVRVAWLFTGCNIVVLCAAIALSFVLARSITGPLEAITNETRPIREGDLSERIKVRWNDEFGQLAKLINSVVEESETLFVSTVNALAAAIDEKSPWTAGHSGRVTQYALDTAQQLNLDRQTMSILRISGLLHDVGKVGVPDMILDKPGRLTDEEFEKMKEHPVKGHRIIAPVRHLERMLPGIRNHHERYDGKGYPDGLKGEAIPFLARLLAVADAFDAMTSQRPYRPGMPEDKALRILADDGGKQWDVEMVDAFMRTRDPLLSKVGQPSDSLELPVPMARTARQSGSA